MLNLLKADLYRITRVHGLRGALWQYLGFCLAVYALLFGSFLMFDPSGDMIRSFTVFSAPSTMLGSMLGSLIPLFVCFFVVEHCLADFKEGFARSLVPARTGRLSYFAERIVFAGVVTVIVFASLSLITLALGAVFGMRFETMDDPLAFIAWTAASCMNVWALAVLSLILVYATRIVPISYIGSFMLCSAIAPETLSLASGLIQAYAPGLVGVADVLSELVCWIPSNLTNWLFAGGASSMAAGWGALGAALPGAGITQAIVAPALWIAAASALVLAIGRKRDI